MRIASLIAQLFVMLFATALSHAASYLGVEVPPPLPAKTASDTYWGITIDDPYRYLEDTRTPEVQTWMKAQAQATESILANLPVRDAFRARLEEIDAATPGVVSSVQRMPSGRLFFLRRNAGENQFKLVRRDGEQGADVVLVDPDALARASGRPHAIGEYAPSPDGRQVVYSVSTGGSEIGHMQVIDADTGLAAGAPIEGIRGGGSVAWLEDGTGFFYTRLRDDWASVPTTERFLDNRRYLHRLDQANDVVVFGPGVIPGLEVPRTAYGIVAPVPGTAFALARVTDGVKREQTLYLATLSDVLAGKARWRKVFDESTKVVDSTIAGGWIYVKTADAAPRYRVLRLALQAPSWADAQVVIPAGEQVVVDVAAGQDAAYITRRNGPQTELLRVAHAADARAAVVELPHAGFVAVAFADPLQAGAIIALAGWTRASQHFAVRGAVVRPLPLVPAGPYDAPDGLQALDVLVPGHDGVLVPLSIIARKDIRLDGRNPTLLWGYGAYGSTQDPGWNPGLLAWLEKGGVFAIVHTRGGGVYGDAWHRAGQKATKPNTWKDGIAAAEWLIARGYTAPGRLGITGGSAGGIFVGRALTERPDLFAAAVVSVGNTDLIRSETRANGVANIHEYGTVKQEEEFHALLAMSPYAHIVPGTRYPAVLFEHGVNDTRVDVWMTLKTGSRLAAAQAAEKPVLLRLEYDAGHGVGSTRDQSRRRTADRWAFLLWQFGSAGAR